MFNLYFNVLETQDSLNKIYEYKSEFLVFVSEITANKPRMNVLEKQEFWCYSSDLLALISGWIPDGYNLSVVCVCTVHSVCEAVPCS